MKKSAKFYLQLFWSTFSLSAFTFGGGFAIISLMRKKFVDKLGWINEQEMLDFTAIAQSSPGALAVNASVVIGYRLAGMKGAVLSVVSTVLPPLVIISLLSFVYDSFRDLAIVQALMRGMQAGVAVIIFDVVISLAKNVIRGRNLLSLLIMIGAFISAVVLKINVMLIIVICGLLGALSALYKIKKEPEARNGAEK